MCPFYVIWRANKWCRNTDTLAVPAISFAGPPSMFFSSHFLACMRNISLRVGVASLNCLWMLLGQSCLPIVTETTAVGGIKFIFQSLDQMKKRECHLWECGGNATVFLPFLFSPICCEEPQCSDEEVFYHLTGSCSVYAFKTFFQ